MDESSLSHTRWKCQYHIIIPKYRRKIVHGRLRKDIGDILRRLYDYKHVEIIEAHTYATIYTAKFMCIRVYGLLKR